MLDVEELAPERMRPLRRSEYEQLVEAGAFEGEHVELLRGVLVEMSPQGEDHIDSTAFIHERLVLALQGRAQVRSHSSFPTSEDSMPEPDVAVVPMKPFGTRPSFAYLVVEVADSSLRKDRKVKVPIYAEGPVREYWIVDLKGRAVEVYTNAVDGTYRSMVRVDADGELRPGAFPDVVIRVADIVPPA